MKQTKHLLCLSLCLFSLFKFTVAQLTMPSAFDLSVGNYSFTNWNASSAAGTYPASMRFYFISNTGDPSVSDTIIEDYTGAYNITSATRIKGVGSDGFSFINTANSPLSSNNYKVGAALLSINTTGSTSTELSWTGKTISTSSRDYVIRLYYRIGDTGVFEPLMNGSEYVEYQRNSTSGHSQVIGPLSLPTITNDQNEVQLLWKYFQSDTNTAGGTRPELAVGAISVITDLIDTSKQAVLYTAKDSLLPFYARINSFSLVDSFEISANNLTDIISVKATNNFQVSTDLLFGFDSIVHIVPSADSLDPTAIYVRYASADVVASHYSSIIVSSDGAKDLQIQVEGSSYSSSDPPPHALIDSDYQFANWPSSSLAGTYPPNMRFQVINDTNAPLNYQPLSGDWGCAYDLSSRSRFNGLDNNGISLRNTASPQFDNCIDGDADKQTFAGGIVLALNTEGVDSADLAYDIQALSLSSGSVSREYAIRLQYRTDSFSLFSDFFPIVEFSTENKNALDQETFTVALEPFLLNQPNVQIRWLFYDKNIENANGSRPVLRLGNVSVKNKKGANINTIDGLKTFSVTPNPVQLGAEILISEKISGKVIDITGRNISEFKDTNKISTNGWAKGSYILRTKEGIIKKIIVQ